MAKNLPATGQVGVAPPPGAPVETSQPLTAEAGAIVEAVNPRTGESYATEDWHRMSPTARARHNERTLEPLKHITQPKVGGVAEAVDAVAKAKLNPFYARMKVAEPDRAADAGGPETVPPTAARRILRRASGVARPPVVLATAEAESAEPAESVPAPSPSVPQAHDRSGEVDQPPAVLDPAAVDPFAPVDLNVYPAGSNTDSPSRGVVRLPIDQGKAITGGFGDQAALEYFALTGPELLVLVETLMDEVHARLVNDLRFSEALTYPQVTARVAIEISGFATDHAFVIDKVLPAAHEARTRTPTEIAREVADQVCFVVLAERRETDDQGNAVEAPDALRRAMELPRPGKRQVRGPGGMTQWVDL